MNIYTIFILPYPLLFQYIGLLGTVTQTADISECPGKCIHALASLLCGQVREDIQCPQGNMRCCVEKPRRKKPNQNPISNNVKNNPTTVKPTTVKVNKVKKKKIKSTTQRTIEKTTRKVSFIIYFYFSNHWKI